MISRSLNSLSLRTFVFLIIFINFLHSKPFLSIASLHYAMALILPPPLPLPIPLYRNFC